MAWPEIKSSHVIVDHENLNIRGTGVLPAVGNPTPFSAASLTKYRIASPSLGQACLTDRPTGSTEYTQAMPLMHILCIVCEGAWSACLMSSYS